MGNILLNRQFLLIGAINLSLFLIISTWSFLPLFIVDIGGNPTDVGLVMGSLGITSLGSLPVLTPLIERYGRKIFILGGALVAGVSNGGFLLFSSYTPLMIFVRLIQGVAFAACFNACSTAVVDLIPADQRAQGIGLFGVSGSLAVALGPFFGEKVLLSGGFGAYFLLLISFGLVGFGLGMWVKEPKRKISCEKMRGFFPTAIRDRHIAMMTLAAVFGAGFSAMHTFFPLYAKTLGLQSGIFFVAYGVSLLLVRVLFGRWFDRVGRGALVFVCLTGFGMMLAATAWVNLLWHTVLLGMVFGVLQGVSYPAMMASMVDRSREYNRAIVVGLFTGSFGVGINMSLFLWGFIADLKGISAMYLCSGIIMLTCAAVAGCVLLRNKRDG